MNPVFSIIIPVYNAEVFLRECLDSVRAQTRADWEAICVDDGSSDGSGAILDDYAARDARFRIIHQANSGVSAARNAALDVARGDWLAFIDADDWVDREYLNELYFTATRFGVEVSICRVRQFCGTEGRGDVGPESSGLFPPEEIYVRYNSLCAWSCGKLFKRSCWHDLRYPVGIAYSEDRFILHEVLYRFPMIAVVGKTLYHYREGHASALGSPWKPKRLQARFAYDRQIEFFTVHNFVKAKYFTAGMYFKWVGSDIVHLARLFPEEKALLNKVQAEFATHVSKYWTDFAVICRSERWHNFPRLGDLRYLVEMALVAPRRASRFKHVKWILMYDGIGGLRSKACLFFSLCCGKITRVCE